MRSIRPLLRRSLFVLGACWVLYLIAGNVFLNTSIGPRVVNRNPAAFQAQWAWAFTLWPGHIYARDLSLHGHARRLLWSAQGTASGRIMLWPLAVRELRFGTIHAQSVTVTLASTATNRKPPPHQPNTWRVRLDRVQTDSLQQVRAFGLQLDGPGSAALGFSHELRGGPTEIFGGRLSMPTAQLHRGSLELLRAARIRATFSLPSVTHAQAAGWKVLDRLQVQLRVDATTPALALRADKDGALDATLAPRGGRLTVDLALQHGALVPGGELHWRMPITSTAPDGSSTDNHGQLDLRVEPTQWVVRAVIPPNIVNTVPAAAAANPHTNTAARNNQLDAQLQLAGRTLPVHGRATELARLSGTLLWRWHFASLRWLNPLIASKASWLRLDGAGDIDANLRVVAGELADGSRVEIPHVALTARVLDNVFSGDAHAHGEVVHGAEGAGASRTHIGIDVERFALAPQSAPDKPYLRGTALTVALQSATALPRFGDDLTAKLHFSNASIPDLRSYNRYLPGKSLRVLGGSGTLGADLTIDGTGNLSAGRLQLHSPDAHIALGVSELTGKLKIDSRLHLAAREHRSFELDDFSLGLDGVHVSGSNEPPWWARVTLEHGLLDWQQPMQLRGQAQLVMKDLSLLLSLFADRSAFPSWITGIIDSGQVTAHGRVDVRRNRFVLDDVTAHNRRADLMARLRIVDGQPDGALYARWGILGLGVRLDHGERDFHLLHAKRWYDAQPALLENDH